jgi:8-oxo-dGTP diphosphatase
MVEDIPEFGVADPGADYVLRPGGYLVVRNSRCEIAVISTPRGFFLPGGGREGSESPAQTAVREADEECGLRVQLGELLGMADELIFDASEKKFYRKRCVFFSAQFVRRNGVGEEDHQLMWMTAEEAVSRLSHESQIWAMTNADRIISRSS